MTSFEIRAYPPACGEARLVVAGEIDMSVTDALFEAAYRLVHTDGAISLELDLTRVLFLDAAAVGALLAVRNTALGSGKSLRVSGVKGLPLEILELTGVSSVLGLKETAGRPARTAETGEWPVITEASDKWRRDNV